MGLLRSGMSLFKLLVEEIPYQVWSDFTQKEFRLSHVNGTNKSQKSEVEHEKISLGRKGKEKKGCSK